MNARQAVLLVDDEQLILDSLRLQIRRMGGGDLAIECANGVSEAWEVLDELQGDGVAVVLVISDWLMPNTRGDAFLEALKARFPGIRRVMLTGQADADALERVRARDLVDRLLLKPWSDHDLAQVLALVRNDA